MTSHDLLLLLGDLAIIIVAARLLGYAAKRIGQPPVLGEILAGVLLGPTLFGGAITRELFPATLRPPLAALATVGLVLFMFIVGYEIDATLIRGREKVAASVSIGSILLPLSLGFLLGIWLAHRHDVDDVAPFALFIGASMSVTAFPVLARILTDRGLHRTRVGGLAIASAAVDDVLAWSLLAVVITIAGSDGAEQWHILLAPVYLAVMFLLVRPALAYLATVHTRIGRLTPDTLAVVLVGLLLSSYATEWMGVHYIFGAFVFGTVMPRQNAAPLREEILERLEQLSVLLLLPVFFVAAGLNVDLSKIRLDGLSELGAILAVAIGGKFLGAYLGARSAGVNTRHAGVLAALMNTRGLTEIVILTVGLQLEIIDTTIFSLMVVMALTTTAMAGPLLRLIYPPRFVQRDLADAERAALGATVAYRVLVLVDDPAADGPIVDLALDVAAARDPSEVVLSRLVGHAPATRLEVGAGLGSELLLMTRTMRELHELVARGAGRSVAMPVFSRFSDDVEHDLALHVATAEPDAVIFSAAGAGHEELTAAGAARLVRVLRELPEAPAAVAVRLGSDADGAAALQIGTQISVSRGIPLVVADAGGRRSRGAVSGLSKHGIEVSTGDVPPGALWVVTDPNAHDPQAHLAVRAKRDEQADTVDDWAGLVSVGRQ